MKSPQLIQIGHDDPQAVKAELLAGLAAPTATIAPKYLYDALGSRLPLDDAVSAVKDGALADSIVLRQDTAETGADPAKLAAYREAIVAVEAWKSSRSSVDEATYWSKLEELLLQAARLNRAMDMKPPSAAPAPGG